MKHWISPTRPKTVFKIQCCYRV